MRRKRTPGSRRRRPRPPIAPQPTEWQVHASVNKFLDRVGITPRMVVDDFERFILHKHGVAGAAFLDLSRGRANASTKDLDYAELIEFLYSAKNASWELSRDITSQYAGRQYANYLSLIASLQEPPTATRIVDIGCDNGIATCFYASQYPHAEVIGIDRCAEGIAVAKHLASILGLTNVRFIHGDAFASAWDSHHGDAWDLVAMTLSGYEALENAKLTIETLVTLLHHLVAPTGTLIAMEPGMTELLKEIDRRFAEQILVNLLFEDSGGNERSAKVMFAHKQKLGRNLVLRDD